MSERPWHEGLDWNTIHTETITLEPAPPMMGIGDELRTVEEWRKLIAETPDPEADSTVAQAADVLAKQERLCNETMTLIQGNPEVSEDLKRVLPLVLGWGDVSRPSLIPNSLPEFTEQVVHSYD